MALTHDVTDTLNDLIRICHDGEAGFRAAAEAIDDSSLRREFLQFSAQRKQFSEELKFRVAMTGEEPVDHGSVTAALHRGWIDLRTAISTRDRHAILAECERGEDAAVEAYRKALSSELPPEFETIVQLQYEDVQRAHDRIKVYRDAAK